MATREGPRCIRVTERTTRGLDFVSVNVFTILQYIPSLFTPIDRLLIRMHHYCNEISRKTKSKSRILLWYSGIRVLQCAGLGFGLSMGLHNKIIL